MNQEGTREPGYEPARSVADIQEEFKRKIRYAQKLRSAQDNEGKLKEEQPVVVYKDNVKGSGFPSVAAIQEEPKLRIACTTALANKKKENAAGNKDVARRSG